MDGYVGFLSEIKEEKCRALKRIFEMETTNQLA